MDHQFDEDEHRNGAQSSAVVDRTLSSTTLGITSSMSSRLSSEGMATNESMGHMGMGAGVGAKPKRDRRARPRNTDARLLTLSDLEEVRLILRGGSVIDWYRLNLTDLGEAKAFVRLLEADPDDPIDIAHGDALRHAAASYLTDHHGYRLPLHLLSCPPIDLFLYAAEQKGRRRDRFFACLLLKAIHILHHVRSRDLRYRLPYSQSHVAEMVIDKVDAFAAEIAAEGFPLLTYEGSEKTLDSVVTKLLMKQETHAATIHDRVRFRFVVEQANDLVPLLHLMTRRLLPFSYVVPGESVNHLVNFTALIESHASYRERAEDLQIELGHEEQGVGALNEHSGRSFRLINFVADIPVRIPDEDLAKANIDVETFGRAVFNLAEIQVVDAQTAIENEEGDNAHHAYKARQLAVVRNRLERGLRKSPTQL